MTKALEIYKIPIDKKKYLFTMPAPIKGAKNRFYATELLERDVALVVSLLSPEEISIHGLKNQEETYRKVGLDYLNFPITDFSTPTDKDSFVSLVQELSTKIEAGKNIVIHCKAGVGRSSLLAGAILIYFGYDVKKVFEYIAKYRGVKVPDKQSQVKWLITHKFLFR